MPSRLRPCRSITDAQVVAEPLCGQQRGSQKQGRPGGRAAQVPQMSSEGRSRTPTSSSREGEAAMGAGEPSVAW
ncbi:hypothetical protein AV530_010174 [Patagioenas fasciata monilis]|uniref:Uncharacterized protein n=1 Tax=Patagioenas fasciata monilis TaxID=372326 RepID=A0A1V4K507_PATFA|nr:hypothetical protein AV530_010174 [Patagioenas fasciata monilis]